MQLISCIWRHSWNRISPVHQLHFTVWSSFPPPPPCQLACYALLSAIAVLIQSQLVLAAVAVAVAAALAVQIDGLAACRLAFDCRVLQWVRQVSGWLTWMLWLAPFSLFSPFLLFGNAKQVENGMPIDRTCCDFKLGMPIALQLSALTDWRLFCGQNGMLWCWHALSSWRVIRFRLMTIDDCSWGS